MCDWHLLIPLIHRHISPCMCVRVCFSVNLPPLADSLSPTALVMEVLRPLCERVECAVDCLYQTPVLEVLLVPVITLLKGRQV